MENREIKIHYEIYKSTEELNNQDKILIERAIEAAHNAYAPYSGFNVGAAILLDNGKIVIGNNQENAAYPSGLCAERVAMFAASSLYPDAIMESIAITAFSDKFVVDFPITPCGSCRQVMSEYETRQRKSMRVILKGAKGEIQLINKIADLLPFMFNADDLKQK